MKETMIKKFENTSFDHCLKCTICTAYCPVAKVTGIYPGPKFSGPDAERLRIKDPSLVDDTLKYCLNCKRCEVVCPHGVNPAEIIQVAKNKYVKKHIFTIQNMRNMVISHTDFLGFWGTNFTTILNFTMKMKLVRFFMELFMKVPKVRVFPTYQKTTFYNWFQKHEAKKQKKYDKQAVYFTGCAAKYQEHQLAKDMVKVMNALGYGLSLTKEKCCGVPLIANGYLGNARSNALHNIKNLSGALKSKNMPIVSASSSCTLALKHEYDEFLCLDNSSIKHNISYITKFIFEEFQKGNIPRMKPVNMKIAYHTPCHLEKMGASVYTIDLLKKIPGVDANFMHSECCGISGTYGFKNENYKISQDIGSDLFRRIDKISPDYVVTDCETCKWQIEMSTKYKVLHPINILAMALVD